MDDEAKPYLLTEAFELTGLSVDALRKRIEQNRLRNGNWYEVAAAMRTSNGVSG